MLLRNGNQYTSLPLAHSTTIIEKYEELKVVLEKISYDEHNWVISVDLKMVNILLGQQTGYRNTHVLSACWIVETKQTTTTNLIGP